MAEPLMEIGVVRSVNPARRELRITGPGLERLRVSGIEWVYVGTTGATPARCKVAKATGSGSDATIALGAGVAKDSVAAMRGATVFVDRASVRKRAARGFIVTDLVGLAVESESGEKIGIVREVIEAPANDVIEIETSEHRRLLLPVIEQVILSVEPKTGRLIVGDIAPYVVTDAN